MQLLEEKDLNMKSTIYIFNNTQCPQYFVGGAPWIEIIPKNNINEIARCSILWLHLCHLTTQCFQLNLWHTFDIEVSWSNVTSPPTASPHDNSPMQCEMSLHQLIFMPDIGESGWFSLRTSYFTQIFHNDIPFRYQIPFLLQIHHWCLVL